MDEQVYNLRKGEAYSLTKKRPTLQSVTVGLGWRARTTTGAEYDLDASAIALNALGKVYGPGWFVFFNNLESPDGTVKSAGDNLEGGDGVGDDEQIVIDLAHVPEGVRSVAIPVSIYDAEARQQNFGQVGRAFIRIVDNHDGRELARFDLAEEYYDQTAIIFGELFRDGTGGWSFRALGDGYSRNLAGVCAKYGIPVGS